MSDHGVAPEPHQEGAALRWPGRVLAWEDLRTHFNGQREIILPVGAVVTPLAADHLRRHAVRVRREEPATRPPGGGRPGWALAQDRPRPMVSSMVGSLEREGLRLKELGPEVIGVLCRWARGLAERVMRGECRGVIVFSEDPALVCCVANKVAGLRAAVIGTAAQASRAVSGLGVNLAALEADGRTFFEIRRIVRTLVTAEPRGCPEPTAITLQELDGHAHR